MITRRLSATVTRFVKVALLATLFGAAALVEAMPLTTNLIVNGNAEAGAGDPVGNATGITIPGWLPIDGFSVLRYDATGFPFVNNQGNVVFAGNFPNAASPGPVDRGDNMFYGGPQRGSSSASQSIDLSAFAMQIDQGNLLFTLSGWMGGFRDQGDSATLALTFLDALGGALAEALIATPDAAARANVTGLFFQSLDGFVPVGARAALLILGMTHVQGRTNDGYADNLSLALVPEPPMLALMLFGLLAMTSFYRRKSGTDGRRAASFSLSHAPSGQSLRR